MKSKILGVILLLAVAAVLGVVVYLAKNNPPEPTPTPKIDKTAELVPSEVERWKTYRNEKYGFEVKYPSLWHFLNDTKTGGLAIISSFTQEMYDKYYFTEEAEKLGENYGRIWITYNSDSLEGNFEKVNHFMEVSGKNKSGNPYQIEWFSYDRINIAGIEAYKFYSHGMSFFRMEKGEDEILIYYLITNKKDSGTIGFEGHFGGRNKEIFENYAKNFETILSTFRFIE